MLLLAQLTGGVRGQRGLSQRLRLLLEHANTADEVALVDELEIAGHVRDTAFVSHHRLALACAERGEERTGH